MLKDPQIDYSVGSNTFLYTLVSFLSFAVIRYFAHKIKYVGDFRAKRTIRFHTLEITIDREITITFSSNNGTTVLITQVGRNIPVYATYDVIQSANSILLDWKKFAKLRIKYDSSRSQHKYQFEWQANDRSPLEDHVMMLEGGHWYGGGHVFHQPWPVEKWYYKLGAYIVRESFPFRSNYGEVMERCWVSSSGIALFVDFDVPLFASFNHEYDTSINLVSCYKSPYQYNHPGSPQNFLNYTIVQTDDVLAAYNSMRPSKIPLPKDIPNEDMFRYPVWSTWAQHKKNITQEKVLTFAKAITEHGFEAAQLEIDDEWTSKYGDWEFDRTKFPDPEGMMEQLKGMGYKVTLWIHPFASLRSLSFWEGLGLDSETWVKWKFGFLKMPALISWWNGHSALLDVTNEKAVGWFRTKMHNLVEKYGIHSFKVDAGEAGRLSTFTTTKTPLDNPNTYTKLFAELSHSLDPKNRAQELRVGVGAQHLPMFFRLQDKDSNWGQFNGLKTIIPHVLTQGLIGYPFVLPDMIGGNAHGGILVGSIPDKELFIRWVQVNALLPAMQFSIVPWMYDKETVQICRKMCALHKKYSDTIIALARESTRTGAPIIRPVWWIAPKDEAALTTSSQFLLGNDILVAPVLEKGARSRDIYLPIGMWRDEISNNQLEGGRWYRNYTADLAYLPHFTKL